MWFATMIYVVGALWMAGGQGRPVPKRPAESRTKVTENTPLNLNGAYSGIRQPRQCVIRDSKAFEALWKEHTSMGSPQPIPTVDFKKYDLIAVFAGSRPTGGHAVKIDSVKREKKGAEIKVILFKPGPGTIVTQAFTYPFEMKSVEKLPADVKFTVKEQAR